jgi:hypothetical protein
MISSAGSPRRSGQHLAEGLADAEAHRDALQQRVVLAWRAQGFRCARPHGQRDVGGFEVEVLGAGLRRQFAQHLQGQSVLATQQSTEAGNCLLEAAQALGFRKALAIDTQLFAHRAHVAGIATVEAQDGDQHQAERIEQLGLHAHAERSFEPLQSLVALSLVEGECAHVLRAQQAARRQFSGMAVLGQGTIEVALLDQNAAQQVVRVGRIRVFRQRGVDRPARRTVVALGHVRTRHAQGGPGRFLLRPTQQLEDAARLVGPLHCQQQFGGQPSAVVPVRLLLLKALDGPHQRGLVLAGVQRTQHVAQFTLATARFQQARAHRRRGVGAHQDPIECRFGRLHHVVVAGFGGDHQEHGAVRQQMFAPQFVQ